MRLANTYVTRISERGFATVEDVLSPADVDSLQNAIEAASEGDDEHAVRGRGSLYAMRNLTEVVPEVRKLAIHPHVARLVAPILGDNALLVRGLLFDKKPEANWGIFWHQDLSIAVRQRENVDGFGPWSVKAGVPHVQPPVAVLQNMLTVRLHLDSCPAENGALQVLPGSHRQARLTDREAEELKQSHDAVTCEVLSGGAVIMRPLLLHSSHRSRNSSRRRVIHLEFAGGELPTPLEWYLADRIASE